jgi:hypothetical protein
MTSNERLAGSTGMPEAPVWQPTVDGDVDGAAEPSAAAEPDDPQEPMTVDAENGPEEAVPVEGISRRTPTRAPARRNRSTSVLLMLSALVALGGVGFAVGRVTSNGSSANNQTNNGVPGFGGANGSFDPGQFGPNASGAPDLRGVSGAGTVSGTVESVTADSMTVRLADGQTVTISLGSSTTYHGQTAATSSDVTTGSTVVVQTTGGSTSGASASASPSTGSSGRTATDVTITSN